MNYVQCGCDQMCAHTDTVPHRKKLAYNERSFDYVQVWYACMCVWAFLDYATITRTYYTRTTHVQETPTDHTNVSKFGHKGGSACAFFLRQSA